MQGGGDHSGPGERRMGKGGQIPEKFFPPTLPKIPNPQKSGKKEWCSRQLHTLYHLFHLLLAFNKFSMSLLLYMYACMYVYTFCSREQFENKL